jgi:S-adenosylmethionine:diacylglycerol 3-amino-3-carboxypropyl transferase
VPRYFTVEIESDHLARDLTDDDLEAFAVAVDQGEVLVAASSGGGMTRRTLHVIACVDVEDESVAREMATAAFRRAARDAGVGSVVVATVELTPDESEERDMD